VQKKKELFLSCFFELILKFFFVFFSCETGKGVISSEPWTRVFSLNG